MLVTFEMSVKNTEREAVYLGTFNKCQKGDNDKTSRNIISMTFELHFHLLQIYLLQVKLYQTKLAWSTNWTKVNRK